MAESPRQTCRSVLVRLFPPLTAQFFCIPGEFVIWDCAHRLPPSLGAGLEAEELMLQFVELALNAGQTFLDSGGFHNEKIRVVRCVAKEGCLLNGKVLNRRRKGREGARSRDDEGLRMG